MNYRNLREKWVVNYRLGDIWLFWGGVLIWGGDSRIIRMYQNFKFKVAKTDYTRQMTKCKITML